MAEPKLPKTVVLRDSPQQLNCPLYSIVGQFAQPNSSFVKHIALIREPGSYRADSTVRVCHSGPPTVAGEHSEARPLAKRELPTCEVVADLALSLDEVASIKTWLSGVDKEIYEAKPATFQQYCILPHEQWVEAETGRRKHRRFSCVGFVIVAYKSADIDLLNLCDLPSVAIDCVENVFVELLAFEQYDARFKQKLGYKGRVDLGIAGDGPWKILLPGYVFHATARAIAENPRPTPLNPISVAYAEYPRAASNRSPALS